MRGAGRALAISDLPIPDFRMDDHSTTIRRICFQRDSVGILRLPYRSLMLRRERTDHMTGRKVPTASVVVLFAAPDRCHSTIGG
jgi:hypothetical protein